MPDVNDVMTVEEVTRCISWINEKAISENDACVVCGSPDNVVIDQIFRIASIPHTTSKQGIQRYAPSIATVCRRCGFTRFFNAYALGILPPPMNPDVPEEGEAGNGEME